MMWNSFIFKRNCLAAVMGKDWEEQGWTQRNLLGSGDIQVGWTLIVATEKVNIK